MLKEGIGFFLMTLGGMGGDSENLILPIVLILIGAWLVIGSKGDE